MKKTESVLVLVYIAVLILGFFSIPLIMLYRTLAGLALGVIYCYFGFALFNDIKFRDIFKKKSYQDVSSKSIVLTIIAGIGLGVLIVFILFRVMRWPNNTIMGLFGIITGLICLVVIVIGRTQKMKFGNSRLVSRLLIFCSFGIVLYYTPEMTIVELKYSDCPEYLQAYKDFQNDPSDENHYDMELERLKLNMSEEQAKSFLEQERRFEE